MPQLEAGKARGSNVKASAADFTYRRVHPNVGRENRKPLGDGLLNLLKKHPLESGFPRLDSNYQLLLWVIGKERNGFPKPRKHTGESNVAVVDLRIPKDVRKEA